MADQQTAADVEHEARNSRALEWAVRVGLLAYGFVHLLVGWVSVRLAFGTDTGSATSKGALAQLARDGVGRLALVAMAGCFAALALWQVIAGLVGYRDRDGWRRHAMRLGAAGRVVAYAYLAFASLKVAVQGHASRTPDSSTASLMSLPAGPFLVAAVGLTAAVIGTGLVVFGIRKDFLGQLDKEARTADRRIPIVVLGQVGYVVKGVAFVVIGVLLCWAAASHDPRKSGGLDQALRELVGNGLGRPAVVLVGVGIGCFGLYLFARSRHLNEHTLTS
jgi:hypothetical protein